MVLIIFSVLRAQVSHFFCAYNFELFPAGHMDKASLLEEENNLSG